MFQARERQTKEYEPTSQAKDGTALEEAEYETQKQNPYESLKFSSSTSDTSHV